MILHIDDSMAVADVQDKFTECFPTLKIEFYSQPHHYKESSPKEQLIAPQTLLSSIRKNHSPENLTISSLESVAQIEYKFRKQFGLNVQVFRQQANSWIQTSHTDKNTLKELSELSSYSPY